MKDDEGRESSAIDGKFDSADDWDNRRLYVRFPFRGCAFSARIDGLPSTVRLRDLSCGGASCLSETPLEVGDLIYLELEKKHVAAALVCWVHQVLVGLRFVNPLDPMLVRRVHAAQSGRNRPQRL